MEGRRMSESIRIGVRWAAAMSLAVAATLGGCVGRTPAPTGEPSTEEAGATERVVSFPAMDQAMQAALDEIIWRHPPSGSYAIGLPRGVTGDRAFRLVERLDDPLAHPMTAENTWMPAYIVQSVSVVGDEARVVVHRPTVMRTEQGGDEGLTQAFTLTLRGGVRPWHVTAVRVWPIGTMGRPERVVVEPPHRFEETGMGS